MATALTPLDLSSPHKFKSPTKRIHDEQDVTHFLNSPAYGTIVRFLFQLNVAMFPQHRQGNSSEIQKWETGSSPSSSAQTSFSSPVQKLSGLITKLDEMIEEAPPDLVGPRRFGNVSFRKWYSIVEERLPDLLAQHLPDKILSLDDNENDNNNKDGKQLGGEEGGEGEGEKDKKRRVRARDELSAYLIGSFGSGQRLDYGTGHELSFLAFLGGIWRLGGFETTSSSKDAGVEERGIVLGIIEPYFQLVRRLIKTYTLEPAGSHGVWGLDDHFFLPYIFGSAQFCPAIHSVTDQLPSDGSLSTAPDPSEITRPETVERLRRKNMYFAAVGFINDVKKGPFWEHSRVLYDISGVRTGWAKINKGMLKMYNAEVLSKFPVIQHFPFGSLFSWGVEDDDTNDHDAPPSPNNNLNPTLTTTTTTTTTSSTLLQPPTQSQPPLLSPPISATNHYAHHQDYTSSLPTVSATLMNPPPTLSQGRYSGSITGPPSSISAVHLPPHHHHHLPPVVATTAAAATQRRPGGEDDDDDVPTGGTKAPWAKPAGGAGDGVPMTKAPWST